MSVFQAAIITTTCPNREEAERIGSLLLHKRLAACVQYDAIYSQYVWQNKICRDDEIRLTIKTERRLYSDVERLILAQHSYECPQILLLPVTDCTAGYLQWLRTSLQL